MTPLAIVSVLMLLAAAGWSVRVLLRTGDWRLRVLTAMLGLAALGQLLALVVRAESLAVGLTVALAELPRLGLGGMTLLAVALLEQATARHSHADEALRRLEKAFDTMQLGVTITDLDGHIVHTNPADAAMHGYSVDELIGKGIRLFAPPGTGRRMRLEQIKELQSWRRETVNVRKDGSVFPVQLLSDVVTDAAGEPIGIVTTCEDVTRRKRMEEELTHQALYDPLTELPNRAFLVNLVDRSIRRGERHPEYMFAVLNLDLDRFKLVNDSLGHTIGDQLLVALSHRLLDCLRPGDVVARLGGDEFAILLDTINDSSDATRVAERIEEALKTSFPLSGRDVFVTASIGIALSGKGRRTPEDFLRDADTAMYRAKARQSERYEIFEEAMHARVTELLQLETDLRNALDREEFRLTFQPVVSVATGRITGFEALVRWQHPDRGLVLPAYFIPLAEETRLIVPLGWWVLGKACHQLSEWRQRFPEVAELSISVNLSAKQFQRADLVERIADTLRENGLEPGRLNLEITESVLMDDAESNVAVIRELHDLGVQVHLDDFGTGYSSLSYLDRFEIDSLKIDRSFINRLGVPDERGEIVHAIVTLARDLGVGVIAEGVETAEQLASLRSLRCDEVQGFLYAQPLDTQAAAALLEAQVGE